MNDEVISITSFINKLLSESFPMTLLFNYSVIGVFLIIRKLGFLPTV